MADLATFEQYYQLTDTLIEQSTKEQLAESVRLLALNIAHHEIRHGEIARDETLSLIGAVEPSPDQSKLLVRGMENLIGVLRTITSGLGETTH
jgi:hypothetical protein